MPTRRTSRERPERTTLPGIADIRITADAPTTAAVLAVLRQEFTITDPRGGYTGGRTYLQADVGNPAPDDEES
ncbi:hypothetical protein [Streptomyces corynorhini]|uniref:Uncharacterized protein n=1 Tax=Streptomyces corynorhini TaxID=2282652 RepID=A0A370B8J4_9ACTN|nr:hypothetical protein [Streptomyces corynorhini]RDG37941.1 hypothetical protein DVH02_11500 [Streptomyces corynorhini]